MLAQLDDIYQRIIEDGKDRIRKASFETGNTPVSRLQDIAQDSSRGP